jgi:soluble cytochrome b562
MSIPPISLNSASLGNIPNNFQQMQGTFQQLTQALQSGNLSAAQSAFTALTKNAPAAGASSPNGTNPMTADFQALGQALQSGNVSNAQAAFSKLQSDAQALATPSTHHHRRHHNDSGESTSGSSSSSGIGSLLNILG